MDEKGFEFAFDVVTHCEAKRDGLHSGVDEFSVPYFGTEVVKERVDEDWSGVFG